LPGQIAGIKLIPAMSPISKAARSFAVVTSIFPRFLTTRDPLSPDTMVSWNGETDPLAENTIDGVRFGAADVSRTDTTPGSGDLLGPPQDWTGDREAYLTLMRERYRRQVFKQRFLFAAWHGNRSRITGPFAAEAREILDGINIRSPAPGDRGGHR
jgi:hypothetical protein